MELFHSSTGVEELAPEGLFRNDLKLSELGADWFEFSSRVMLEFRDCAIVTSA